MADVTKTVNMALAPAARYIVLTNSEVASGDIIRVVESMARAADSLTIETSAGSDLSIRINPRVKVAKRRSFPENEPYGWALGGEKNAADITEFDSGVDSIVIGSATSIVTYQLNDLPIADVEVVYTSGTFSMLFS